MRHYSSLATALSLSATLHAGAVFTLDRVLGVGTNSRPETVAALRPAQMFASLSGPLADAPSLAATERPSPPTTVSAPGLIDLPMPQYFSAGDLDRKPEAVGEVLLAYPTELPHVKQSRVVLSLLIGDQGTVDRVIVESADAPKEFEELASQAFAAARFTPGLRNGITVRSRLRIEVTFEGEAQ